VWGNKDQIKRDGSKYVYKGQSLTLGGRE